MIENEQNLLLDIKQRFGWPVDGVRYCLPFPRRYWDGKEYSDLLPKYLAVKAEEATKKLAKAQEMAAYLKRLPWIHMIFVTGSVASSNALPTDDIDVWIVVEPRRIWLTRAFDWLLFTFTKKRRLVTDGTDSAKTKDKFCFNFYTTTNALELSKHTRSFAMQFVDAVPVFIRNNSDYKALLEANAWVHNYFPSWYNNMQMTFSKVPSSAMTLSEHWSIRALEHSLEYLAGILMLLKSRKRLYFSLKDIFVPEFTTWGTERILTEYDTETVAERSKEIQ